MRRPFTSIAIPEPELVEICRRHHVRELALFGSVLRADFREDSDVDVLVEFEPDAHIGLFEVVDLKEKLTALLGRDIDLVGKNGLNEHIREHILKTAVTIYSMDSGYQVPDALAPAPSHSPSPVDRDFLRLQIANDACAGIEDLINGDDRSTFETNDLRRSAMLFELLRTSEALMNVSPDVKARHRDIPWQRVVDAGQSTVGIDRRDQWDDHWTVATTAIPLLRDRIRSILASEFGA